MTDSTFLFRRGSGAENAEPEEKQLLEQQEKGAIELDRLAKRDEAPETIADAFVRRKFLLGALEDYGIFEAANRDARRAQLVGWGLDTLVSYLDAGRQVLDYLASPERKQLMKSDPVMRVVGAPVSVDWFRFPREPPEGRSVFGWLAACEFLEEVSRPRRDAFGVTYTNVGGAGYALYWRKDDGEHRCLYDAIPPPGVD